MAFCKKCGAQIDDEAVVCPSCGVEVEKKAEVQKGQEKSFGYGLLGFCIPVVGLILYLVWKQEKPGYAKSSGIGAIIGAIISGISYIIYFSAVAAPLYRFLFN